jgi:hypothetical protein
MRSQIILVAALMLCGSPEAQAQSETPTQDIKSFIATWQWNQCFELTFATMVEASGEAVREAYGRMNEEMMKLMAAGDDKAAEKAMSMMHKDKVFTQKCGAISDEQNAALAGTEFPRMKERVIAFLAMRSEPGFKATSEYAAWEAYAAQLAELASQEAKIPR